MILKLIKSILSNISSTSSTLVFFDLETPNRLNNSICQIGIVVTDGNKIIHKQSILVNPETVFDFKNIKIHGIKAETVKGSPTFEKVWDEISGYFTNSIIVGYNVVFDLTVLSKSLNKYHLVCPQVTYCDLLPIAKDVFNLPNYSLDTVCKAIGYDFSHHHDAYYDALACTYIYEALDKKNLIRDSHFRKFTFDIIDNRECIEPLYPTKPSSSTLALRELLVLIQSIISDGKVEDDEVMQLEKWIKEHNHLKKDYPYDILYPVVEKVLTDGIIDEEENIQLSAILSSLSKPLETSLDVTVNDIAGKNVCITGYFDIGSRDYIYKILEGHGATVTESVLKKTDILIIGSLGSSAWAYGTYGNKVKKALEMKEKGSKIIIVKEFDFFK